MTAVSASRPVVGFVGLGAIGRPMAERIGHAGFPLVVHDLRPDALAPFAATAAVAGSAREVGDRSDVVIGCLSSLAAYRTMVGGESGLARSTRAKVYVHVGTTGVPLLLEIAGELQGAGIATLDAPMSGGVPRAKIGTLTVMAAGDRAAFEAAVPILETYASEVLHLSETIGAGQHMKLLNNMLSAANLAVAAEILLFGVKAGLRPRDMLAIVNASTGQNSATLTKIPNHVLTGSFDYGGSMPITIKDLGAFRAEADRLGVPVPLSEMVRATYERAADRGSPGDDMTRVVLPMEQACQALLRDET